MSEFTESHFDNRSLHDTTSATPRCPLCGGTTALKQERNAVRLSLDVYRCTVCNVHYPVVKKRADSGARGEAADSNPGG